MPSSRFPLAVSLSSRNGKVKLEGTINSQTDSCTFDLVPPGEYTVSGLFLDGSRTLDLDDSFFPPDNSRTYYLQGSGISTSTSISSRTQSPSGAIRSKPPAKAIAGFAVSAALASNFGGATPLVKEISNTLFRSQQAQSASIQQAAGSQLSKKTFSSRVEAQLKACVKNNAIYFAEIPTLVKLLKSASWERDSDNEFDHLLIDLYADYQQLRIAIDRCDPMLAQEVLVAKAKAVDSDETIAAFVTGSMVNVRVAPSISSRVIEPLPYGTSVLLDQSTMAILSEDQRLAISQGRGWQPIILPTGESGYIYSLYVRAVESF